MTYSRFDWKFVIAILAGFIIGIFFAAMISPWVSGNQFLVPFIAVSIVGFSWWFCRLPTLKKTLLAVCAAVVTLVLLNIFLRQSEEAQIKSTMRKLGEQVERPK